jgi:hypothetical protein
MPVGECRFPALARSFCALRLLAREVCARPPDPRARLRCDWISNRDDFGATRFEPQRTRPLGHVGRISARLKIVEAGSPIFHRSDHFDAEALNRAMGARIWTLTGFDWS